MRWIESSIESFGTQASALLIDPKEEDAVARALTEFLLSEGYDLVLLRGLRSPVDALERLLTLPGAVLEPATPILGITPTLEWSALEAGLSRKMRRTLRHDYAALKRADENFGLRVVAAPDSQRASIETFLTLFQLSLQGQQSPLMRSFEVPEAREFLRTIFTQMAAGGMLRMFSLEVAGRVVAMRVGFVTNDVLYLHLHADDPEMRRHGALTVTMAQILKYAIHHRLAGVQLGTGRPRSCTRWKADEVSLSNIALWRAGMRGDLVRAMRNGRRHALAAIQAFRLRLDHGIAR